MGSRQTILTVIALALACVAVIGYKLSARWHSADAIMLPRSSCNPSVEDCTISLPRGGQLRLSIAPRPIRALQKLSLEVAITGWKAEKVEIDFDGVDMSMGYNRPVLSGDGRKFSGQTMLPVCITGTMTWKATVVVTTDKERIAAPFHFEIAGR